MSRFVGYGICAFAVVLSIYTPRVLAVELQGPVVCPAYLGAGTGVSNDAEQINELFAVIYKKFLQGSRSSVVQKWILSAYARSNHPNKVEVFRHLFTNYSGAKALTLFERLVNKLDEAPSFPAEHLSEPEVRQFLRLIHDPHMKELLDTDLEAVVSEMVKMSREDRLIVFRQAFEAYDQIKLEDRPQGFFEVLWHIARRLGDKELIELTKAPSQLNETRVVERKDQKRFLIKIDQKFSSPTLGGLLHYFGTNGPGGNDVSAVFFVGYTLSVVAMLVGLLFGPTSLFFGTLKIYGFLLASSILLKVVHYHADYPTGKYRKEVVDQLTLRAHTDPAIKVSVGMINLLASGGTIAATADEEPHDTKTTVAGEKSADSGTTAKTADVKKDGKEGQEARTLDEILKGIHSLRYIRETAIADVKDVKAAQEGWVRFSEYFSVLRRNAIGRDDLIQIIQYAIAGGNRLNILLLGPTGVGKSFIADALGSIKDKENLNKQIMFKLLMTPETARSEVDGPLSYSKAQNDEFERITVNSILNFRFAFLDEIFDYPRIRNLLNALEEGVLRQGAQHYEGILDFAIGATNKFITEIYDILKGNNAQAPQDRFAWIYVVAGELSTVAENLRLMDHKSEPLPDLFIQDILAVRKIIDQVQISYEIQGRLLYLFQQLRIQASRDERDSIDEHLKNLRTGNRQEVPPYRSTRVYSPRSLKRAMRILQIIAAFDWLHQQSSSENNQPLIVKREHLILLESYFKLGGPQGQFLERLIDQTHDPLERQQYMIVKQEGDRFKTVRMAMESDLKKVVLNKQLSVFESAHAEGRLAPNEEHKMELAQLGVFHNDLETALRSYQSLINQDGPITVELVSLPDLQARYNKLLEKLGIAK